MLKKMHRCLKAFALGLGLSSLALSAIAHDTTCQKVSPVVKLSETATTSYQVKGWLCWRGSLENKTVQLLVHGLASDHNYWDFPYRSDKYSYVDTAVEADYATLNIDRLGIGDSGKPAALALNAQSSAYVIHQLVQKLRGGTIGNHAFEKVILVGHSFGSTSSLIAAATYRDVDAIILTGFAHQNTLDALIQLSKLYPAQLDPRFISARLPLGYLTTQPGARTGIFFDVGSSEVPVRQLDDILKQTATTGELATLTAALDPSISLSLTIPVMLAIGERDALFCSNALSCADKATFLARENPYFGSYACLETFVLPKAGHGMNLHSAAKNWFNAAVDWADRRIGTNGQTSSQPCS